MGPASVVGCTEDSCARFDGPELDGQEVNTEEERGGAEEGGDGFLLHAGSTT